MRPENESLVQDWLLWLTANFFGYAFWFCLGALPLVILGDRDNDFTGVLFFSSLGVMTGLAQWLVVVRWHIRQAGWWILATAIGWPTGLFAGIAVASWVNVGNEQAGIAVWIVLGAALGLTQWLVLRNKVQHAEWWILASMALWSTSGLIGIKVADAVNGPSVTVASSADFAGILTTLAFAESTKGLVLVWLLHRPIPDNISPVSLTADQH